jgi:hypothetical protein
LLVFSPPLYRFDFVWGKGSNSTLITSLRDGNLKLRLLYIQSSTFERNA